VKDAYTSVPKQEHAQHQLMIPNAKKEKKRKRPKDNIPVKDKNQ